MAEEEGSMLSLKDLKDYILLSVAIISAIAGIIFWVQSSNDEKISRLDRDIEVIHADINKIKDNNTEILRVVGRLEGKLDNLK